MNPAESLRTNRLFHGMCLFVLFAVASAASFSGFYQRWHFREDYSPATFDKMTDGTAHRPYIFRQLLPDVANWLTRALPIDAIYHRISESRKEKTSARLNLSSTAYPVQYLIVYTGIYLAALLATFALYLVCTAADLPPPIAVFTPVIFMLLFPLFGIKAGFIWDYPELLFMGAAAWIALRFDWWWIIPVAALGTWNKESFLLFMLTLYPLLRRRYSRVTSMLAVSILVAVCVAIYLPIRFHFAHNPGGTVEHRLNEQIAFYLHPFKTHTWFSMIYGLIFPALSGPIPTLLLIWFIWRVWKLLPLWLKRHAQIAAIINFPLYFLFCAAGEYRDLSLLYISFLLVVGISLDQWMQQSAQLDSRTATQPQAGNYQEHASR